YTVTVTNGCTNTATTTLTVNPLPVVNPTSNSAVCPGGTIDLFANAPTATNIAWSGPNGFTFIGANPSIPSASAANAGIYTVAVSDANGCTNTASTSVAISSNFGSASSNSPVCTGNTLTLSATGGTNYDWTGPNGFATTGQTPSIANVTALAAGTYTVTITNGTCTATATTNVTVNTSPTVSPSNSSPACVGDMVTLSAANTTGTITNYAWAGPNAYSGSGQTSIVNNIQLTQAGTYTVTVTDGNNCTATGTTNVIVNGLPTPAANSNSPLCIGNTLNLSASGGTSYAWAGPNGFVSNVQNPSVNNVSLADAGIYTVTVTNANNCSSVATTNVVINSSLATNATSNSPVCSGDILSFSSVPGAVGYSWAGPNGFSSTAQNPAISNVQAAAAGSYSVTVTAAGGCTGTSVVNVVINPNPTPFASSNSPVCSGGTLNLSSAAATTYNWAGPCINASNFNQQNPVINNAGAACGGVYTVTVTNGNCSAVATTTVTIGGGNIADFTYAVLNFCQNSPNPTPIPLNGGAAGVYTGTAGLVIDPVTGIINLNGSTTGNFTVTNTVTGTSGCTPDVHTVNISISPAPNANFAYPASTYCQTSATNPAPNISGNYTYTSANPNNTLFIDPITGVITLASSSPGIYQVTNTVAPTLGCPGATATQVIVIEAAPDAEFSLPQAVYCTSEPNIIPQHTTGVNGAYTYIVVSGGPTLAIDAGTGIINPAASNPGTYTITNTVNGTSACPAAMFTNNITIVAAPDAEFAFNQATFCVNGTNPVISHTTGANGTYSYAVLTGGPTLSMNTATGAINLAQSDPGTYQVTNTVAATGSCPSATYTQLITINTGVNAEFAYNKQLFCGGGDAPVVLHTSGVDGIYSVSQVVSGGPNLLINQTTGSINLTLSNFGTYQITNTVQGSGGCPDATHTVTITYAGYPVATISPSSTIDFCTNENITLNGSGGAAYQWLQNNFPIVNQVGANYQVTAPGNYSVVAYNTEGCADTTDYVIVARVNEPKASVAALGQTTFCQNASLPLQADGDGLYQWLYNGVPISGATASTYTATQAGTYQVILSNYCGTDTSAAVLTQVTAPPIPNFVWEPSVVFANENVAFLDSSRSAAFWDWNFGDNGNSTIQNPSHIYSTPGVYQVTMYIKDILGCDSVITKTLTVLEPGEPFIPNIFTPNGDDVQEEWLIDFKGYNNVAISVFDRWGKQVFETNDKNEGWAGFNMAGQKCPVGVYFYLVTAADATGNFKQWKGNVTLLKN
ncbi:MAG: gliding motility-associated C-terminal domain-containing protein, partial [Bacteroidia bacterium]